MPTNLGHTIQTNKSRFPELIVSEVLDTLFHIFSRLDYEGFKPTTGCRHCYIILLIDRTQVPELTVVPTDQPLSLRLFQPNQQIALGLSFLDLTFHLADLDLSFRPFFLFGADLGQELGLTSRARMQLVHQCVILHLAILKLPLRLI